MVAPAGTIPDVEAHSKIPILVHTIELQNEDLINMSSPLKKDFIVCNTETAEERDSSCSGDEISIHVESPSIHDQSLSNSALIDSTRPKLTTQPSQKTSLLPCAVVVYIFGRGSPSSSISAPLRAPLTEADSTPGWGTLGQRVGLFAVSNRLAAEARNAKHHARRRAGLVPGEHSALLGDRLPPRRYDGNSEEERDDEALLSRQIDLVFGKWPWRLLNHHWWWWQLQPILCCGCLDEPDDY
ncbi:hypothetical protein MSAN_00804100 [Mycena sanguinolenta]|uniref:Uncharacterized protein n=1 Tax=Mycena sanguinolenta TaxID=230812 RepID=A0A8H6Z131_9AGAR|nr:hypothetical protein MSAN_00804100 [Mycena sanguinolenta]